MNEPKSYAVLAALVLVVYDYLLTFSDEVELVWQGRFTFGTVLFALCRYLPFIDIPVSIPLYMYANGITAAGCHNLFVASVSCQYVGIAVAQTILILRTFALWQRNIYIVIGLGVSFLTSTLFALYTTVVFMVGTTAIKPSGMPCTVDHVGEGLMAGFITLLAIETSVVVLTVVRATYHLHRSNSSWVYQMYLRGILYFFFTFAVTLLSLFCLYFAPVQLKLILMDIQRAFHSILCSRIIFLILSQRKHKSQVVSISTCREDLEETTSGLSYGVGARGIPHLSENFLGRSFVALDTLAGPDETKTYRRSRHSYTISN
ncbi:hypothetical protein CPB83DRAFT_909691 [Crepidotus variabilis]|uniref:DUF6533 domain-containing protein n=1 Tax=Crepidotus variabilis TaxID=179855 RepID=A0A9P6E991_9AGAR|nr:hypothetical protein CPB83DRAFT_909691 [Crepidotus variabilis]